MLTRVPKVIQSNGLQELNQEALEAFEAGYPVRIAENLPCILSDSLRNKVLTWPSKGIGTKNPSWIIEENQLKPGALAQMADAEKFQDFLGKFQKTALSLVGNSLKLDESSLRSDRVTWRPYELATMPRRWNARDDLFHLDSFPSRPAQGRRILRFFYNASPSDYIVWSHTFNLDCYISKYFKSDEYLNFGEKPNGFGDSLMVLIHDRMKRHEDFQETAPRVLHSFAPGEGWIALTDTCLHSFLRGEWLMDISWFVSAPRLMQSQWSPRASFDRLMRGISRIETAVRQAA